MSNQKTWGGRVIMQCFQDVFELKQPPTIQTYTQEAMNEPHGSHQPRTCSTYTKNKEERIQYNTKETHQIIKEVTENYRNNTNRQ